MARSGADRHQGRASQANNERFCHAPGTASIILSGPSLWTPGPGSCVCAGAGQEEGAWSHSHTHSKFSVITPGIIRTEKLKPTIWGNATQTLRDKEKVEIRSKMCFVHPDSHPGHFRNKALKDVQHEGRK